jgi:hypothetical protein
MAANGWMNGWMNGLKRGMHLNDHSSLISFLFLLFVFLLLSLCFLISPKTSLLVVDEGMMSEMRKG